MRKKGIRKPSPWDKNYAPYGKYEGARGNADQWAESFRARFSEVEINTILGADDPWGILGLKPGATQLQIKVAFFKKAKETHPDHHPEKDGSEFRKVKAAYDKLT